MKRFLQDCVAIKNLILICGLLFIGDSAWAGGSDGYFYYYYAKVTAQTASESAGRGSVYVSTAAASQASATTGTSNAKGQDPNDYGETTDAPSEAGQVTFYLYANPTGNNKFDGWSKSATRPDVFESTNPVWQTTFGASTTQGSSSTTNPGGTKNSGTTASDGKTQYYSTSTAEYTIYAYFSEKVMSFDVTFIQPSNGSIKVGGVSPSSWPYEVSTTTGELTTTLTATPASGYSFWGWYTLNKDGSKNYLSYEATYNATFNDATTVYAEFYSSSLALYQTAGVNFYDLNLANAKAVANGGGTIIVTKNGTVPAGNYTIASGVTLLVPLNSDNQVHTEPSVVTSGTPSRSVYRTLTLDNGTNITLNGSICVDAIMCLTMGYNGSAMNGYGLIDMKAGSTITMKSGSNFYVWGFVIGDGSIVAESGATIHETFQFKHRGGNALTSIASTNASKKVFPINQYYIQSIEAPITFRKGATEKVYTGVHNVAEAISIDFIGTSGLFKMTGTGAYLIKKYDVSKDRQNYTLYGDATIGSIKFGMTGFYKESKNFVLPITNNMTLNVESGTTTIQYETAILPDVEVNIASGAKISSSGNCYVYDSLNWKGAYAYANDYSKAEAAQIAPVVYRHGGLKYNRKNYKLRDAAINVNGTLDGKIYTTEGGANIKSSLGTGVVKFTAALSSTTTYQAGQDGTTGKFDAYTVYPAQLHNASQWYSAPYTGDGKACEYLATAGTAANTTINYKNGHWGWVEVWKNGETVLAATNTVSQVNNAAAKNSLIASIDVPDGYEIVEGDEWETTVDDTNQEVIHSVKFVKIVKYAITWDLDNGSANEVTYVKQGEKPTHATPEKPASVQDVFAFDKWSDGKHYYTTADLPAATADATYKATYNATTRQYTVTWKNQDGTTLDSKNVNWGWTPEYTGATPTYADGKKLYAFRRWKYERTGEEYGKDESLALVAGDETYTAQYDVVAVLIIEEDQTYNADVEVETTVVRVQGKLRVSAGKTFETEDLILEGSLGESGEIENTGTINATNVCFDLSNGENGFKARTWYAIAVPWQVDVPAYNQTGCGVYLTNNGVDYTQQELGSTFDLLYYDGALRAAQGHSSKCWKLVEKDAAANHIIFPGRAYMIYLTSDAKTIRFKKKAGKGLFTTETHVQPYSGNGNAKDANWNGIANPATFHAYLNTASSNKGQVYIAGEDRYEAIADMSTRPLVVGQPVFVQATSEKTVVACATKEEYASHAPRRMSSSEEEKIMAEVRIAPVDKAYTDRLYVGVEEVKADEYEIGKDLAKAGISTKVAQMWVNRYNTELCINSMELVNNRAEYPLTISAPAAGEYTIGMEPSSMAENQTYVLYLTLNGQPIWNLNYNAYTATLEKGRTEGYGLRLVYNAPEIATGIEETTIENGEQVRKVMIDEKVYILRGGQVYSIDGQLVK